nr:hypothetical protein [uncultured Mediterraneibacter sp.]
MIRECNASDLETLEAYLKEEVYGKAILSLIEKNGFEQAAQSVYGDFEEGVCKGVYLCIYKNLLLYCKENQVDIDFLEQIVSMQVPEVVAGRPDNVNVISWLLTDYRQEKAATIPELLDQEGQPLESGEECSGAVEKGWGILLK